MKRNLFITTAGLLLIIFLIGHAYAISYTLYPEADAFVFSQYPDTTYGSLSPVELKVAYRGTNQIMHTYLKFNLSSLNGVDAEEIKSAYLHLYCSNGGYDNDKYVTVSHVTDDGWTEDGITWNNKPQAGATMFTATSPPNYTVIYNLLENGNEWVAGDLNDDFLSIVLSVPYYQEISFYSKEYYVPAYNLRYSPYIEINPVPLPGALLLLGAGLLRLAHYRRRKLGQ